MFGMIKKSSRNFSGSWMNRRAVIYIKYRYDSRHLTQEHNCTQYSIISD